MDEKEGKILYLHDLGIDDLGNVERVDGTDDLLRRIANRLDPTPPKVLPFPAPEVKR